jgi:hypothetical protein
MEFTSTVSYWWDTQCVLGDLDIARVGSQNIRDLGWEKPDFDGSIVATAASSLVGVKTRISLTIALSNARKQDTAVVKSGDRAGLILTYLTLPLAVNAEDGNIELAGPNSFYARTEAQR